MECRVTCCGVGASQFMILDTPFIRCRVLKQYLTNNEKNGFEYCYIFAVTCIAGRPPLFTCHTENGAVYSRLPLEAFFTHTPNPDPALCPWSCVGHKAQIITHEYLKDYDVKLLKNNKIGRYLFTIDYEQGNYSEDPTQHKTHNIIELESGQFAAMPNNYCQFIDEHFINKNAALNHYRRQETYHTCD